ncbi:ABC transporter permease [Adhaeribacter aquaticus]|uniref:ABC transporter permease n=1 Tax=Adhaeribacter aquaticus TaxID=299567 RepID=UPI000403786A|nr:ABC transporter permease [Adhaeribacter aquaticus]
MFYNYFKIAIRNLLRYKAFSFINIFGLALGMTCSILIMLWVKDELSYDQFHSNLNNLYRVIEEQHYPGGEDLTMAATPAPLAEALKKDFPEITHAVTIIPGAGPFTYQGKTFKETGLYTTPDFFQMFSFEFITGNPKTALTEPYSVIITETLAKKYFGNSSAFGKLFKVDNKDSYKVSGVVKDVPQNSSLEFSFVMPAADLIKQPGHEWLNNWKNNGPRTYVMLRRDANKKAVDAKIEKFIRKHNPDADIDIFLQGMEDMYLYNEFRAGRQAGGRIGYVRLFSVVAIFILIIACINFMNLSTARSAKRAKEVGVRKVIGAVRSVLVGQFIGESVLIAFFAILISLGLTLLFLPTFNGLTSKNINLSLVDPVFLLSVVGIALLTGVLAGSYPALFLSSFKPVTVLKGTLKFSSKVALFRKSLVVFQFVLSAILIISTLVVFRQVEFIRNKNIGLNRENVAYVAVEGDLIKHYKAYKHELEMAPGILSVSVSSQSPIMVSQNGGGVEWKGKDPSTNILFSYIRSDADFLKTMDIKLKEGRFFSEEFGADSTKIVINEEAARIIGIKNPIGESVSVWGDVYNIIGVVRNFDITSVHMNTQPLIIFYEPEAARYVFVRTKPGQTADALSSFEKLTIKYNPNFPFIANFLDQDFNKIYQGETVISKLANYFAAFAIIISCLGLFGLALFTAEQRTKEIGIRKVLGASVPGIVAMLSKDFLKLVLLANIIAWPLGWYFMYRWLQDYAFRTEINWWIFGFAGVATLVIALLTVSFQAIRAAMANPVKAIRTE